MITLRAFIQKYKDKRKWKNFAEPPGAEAAKGVGCDG